MIYSTKVVCAALQDAGSVAGLLITTDAAVAEKPEKKNASLALGMGTESMNYWVPHPGRLEPVESIADWLLACRRVAGAEFG